MVDKSGMPTVCKVNQHKDTRVSVLSVSRMALRMKCTRTPKHQVCIGHSRQSHVMGKLPKFPESTVLNKGQALVDTHEVVTKSGLVFPEVLCDGLTPRALGGIGILPGAAAGAVTWVPWQVPRVDAVRRAAETDGLRAPEPGAGARNAAQLAG